MEKIRKIIRETIKETIRKVNGKYVVYPERGGKRLGTHSTKAAAEKQLQAIHIQQHNEIITPADPSKVDPKELKMGIKVEMEHTDDPEEAKVIALQHLAEDPKYYTKLKSLNLEMLNYPNWLRNQAQTPQNNPDGEHRFYLPKKKKIKEFAMGMMSPVEKARHNRNMHRLMKILNKHQVHYFPYPNIPNTLVRKLYERILESMDKKFNENK
jgi:hypothetical protein